MLGLTPQQFWGMPEDIWSGITLAEYDLMLKGFAMRQDMAWDRAAFTSANIMNCFVGKDGQAIKPKDLLKGPEEEVQHADQMKRVREIARQKKAEAQDKLFKRLGVQETSKPAIAQEKSFAQRVIDSMQTE